MIARSGRKLGKYEIVEKLGRGGMADVYLARDGETGGLVALKLIEHSADPDIGDSIEAERQGTALQARLAEIDPRVARVYDSGDLDGYFFIAMEYIDGEDLGDRVRRGPLPVDAAVAVALDVALTLENAHKLQVTIAGKDFQGIVHGDIKPKNIRIDAQGRTRVLDFGIAKALSLSRRLTRNEFGSVPYASPERLDTGQVDARSDIWSLAVMLYEMATGLQPYQAATTEELERKIRSRIPPPPAPDPCPEPLRRILIKALAPDHELRYATASALAEDLTAFREGRPVRAVAEDMDATRRTVRGAANDDPGATRRTAPPAAPGNETRRTARPVKAVEWPRMLARVRRGSFGRFLRAIALVALIAVLYITWSVFSSFRLYGRGQEFERQVETEQIKDLDQIWTKWTELSAGHSSSWFLRGPRSLVKQRMVNAAERTITAYRNDAQQIFEADWKRARTQLSHALEADPDDTVRGELRLCEGHLARINGTARRNAASLNESAQDFLESQKLLPKSPDPELGLARLYVYGLKDIDKAYEALRQAEKRGYQLGNRDKTQLADGYLDRADRLWWDSGDIRGLPAEREQVARAERDYQTALDLYTSVAPYGSANAQIVRVQADLESVRSRLLQLDQERKLFARHPAHVKEAITLVIGRREIIVHVEIGISLEL